MNFGVWQNPLGSPTSCSTASVWLRRIVWISSGLWFCGRSEIESKSSWFRCLSPRRLVASNLCLVTRYSQQVILVPLIYCREDRATLAPIHIGNLSLMQGNVWIEDIFQEILLTILKRYSEKQEPSSRRDHQHFSKKLHPIKKITKTCLQSSKP